MRVPGRLSQKQSYKRRMKPKYEVDGSPCTCAYSDNDQYDMLTSPITNAHFRDRVLALLSLSRLEDGAQAQPEEATQGPPSIKIPPLTHEDTHLAPGSITPQLLAIASPWIDLCSPDPLVAELSRQVLLLEVAYAAFCGIAYIFLPAPRLHYNGRITNGLPLYARAVLEACMTGSHLDVFVMLPMVDNPDEGKDNEWPMDRHTQRQYWDTLELDRQPKVDVFGTWDAWNVVRTVCKYAPRLFVGKIRLTVSQSILTYNQPFFKS